MVEIEFYARNVVSSVPVEINWGLLGLFIVGLLVLVWWKGFWRGWRYGAVLLLAEWICLMLCAIVFFREAGAERGYNLMPFWS